MAMYPGFVVRSYRNFAPARIFRVFIVPDVLYFLRARGIIRAADAGTGHTLDPGQLAIAAIFRWLGRRTIEKARAELDGDPEELVRSSRKHIKLLADEMIESRLDPPSMLRGHGFYYARWQVVTPSGKSTYQIEDADSLNAALDHLPGLLGPRLAVNVETAPRRRARAAPAHGLIEQFDATPPIAARASMPRPPRQVEEPHAEDRVHGDHHRPLEPVRFAVGGHRLRHNHRDRDRHHLELGEQ